LSEFKTTFCFPTQRYGRYGYNIQAQRAFKKLCDDNNITFSDCTPQSKAYPPQSNENIKLIREELGLKQKEFAEVIGVTDITISNWEKSIHGPNIQAQRTLGKFCEDNNITFKGSSNKFKDYPSKIRFMRETLGLSRPPLKLYQK